MRKPKVITDPETQENYQIDQLFCDNCGRQIKGRDPLIYDQSTLVLLHPDQDDVVVHIPNGRGIYQNHYCLECALQDGVIPFMTDEERKNVINAIATKVDRLERAQAPQIYGEDVAQIVNAAAAKFEAATQQPGKIKIKSVK